MFSLMGKEFVNQKWEYLVNQHASSKIKIGKITGVLILLTLMLSVVGSSGRKWIELSKIDVSIGR